MNALIVVDVQNDFLPAGALPVPRGDEVVAVANRLLAARELFPIRVATQDWHPPGHGSFASSHPGAKPGDLARLHGLPQLLWPDHCVQGGRGAQFAPGLDVGAFDRVFRKGDDPSVDSYSGFFDNGRRRDTGLGEYLRRRGATRVFVLGLATDYCVKLTALDARMLGFPTTVLIDGCRGVELKPGDVARALRELRAAGCVIADSAALAPVPAGP
ncbi:MAG: bifunctional nicotinamidase/pyrazinamidase [Elusimicrobia bacterium]|nr:bifunctional nicotinamidase/pyrazinamidase [Elusimicrobiota bacterium]